MNKQSIPHEIIFPKENLDVYFELFDDESSFVSSHWHNSLEIIYITSGNLNVKLSDQTIELNADDIILINSRVVHSTHSPNGNTAILIQIPSQFLRHYMPEYDSYYFDFDISSKDERYLTKLSQIKEVLKDMEVIETVKPEAGNLHFSSLVFKLYSNYITTSVSHLVQDKSNKVLSL